MSPSDRKRDLKKSLIQRMSLGRFVYRVPASRHLYLTFDDGPHEQYTPALLDVLQHYGVRASFFLVGRSVERNRDLVKQLQAAGQTIGLHTHTHKTIDRMTRDEFITEMRDNRRAISDCIAVAPDILRPPEGRIDLKSLYWAISSGLRVIHYTFTSNDWKADSAADITCLYDQWPLRGGEILSFHDNNPHTIEAIPVLIERCLQRGFRFAAIGQS